MQKSYIGRTLDCAKSAEQETEEDKDRRAVRMGARSSVSLDQGCDSIDGGWGRYGESRLSTSRSQQKKGVHTAPEGAAGLTLDSSDNSSAI